MLGATITGAAEPMGVGKTGSGSFLMEVRDALRSLKESDSI